MGGSATLGTNLVDSLVSTVDDLRGSLNTAMGTRQWRVFTRQRTWSNGRVGDGSAIDVDTELTPAPRVRADNLYRQPIPAGMDEMGDIVIDQVSLTYTEAELAGGPGTAGVEWFIVLKDAQGQATADRLYQLKEPPKPDRTKTIGWVMRLQRSTDTGVSG